MTEVSEAAKARAAELMNAVSQSGVQHWDIGSVSDALNRPPDVYPSVTAFARFIQDVSDAAKEVVACDGDQFGDLAHFILPEPVDPLAEALRELGEEYPEKTAERLSRLLARRNLKIVPADPTS